MRLAPILLGLFTAVGAPAQVVISEFMASNQNSLRDADGDRPDWIELHNAGTTAVDLGGMYLTDDPARPTRWQFPSPTTVPAAGFLIVFASGKNRTTPGSTLHTDFSLARAGEYLGLVAADGTTALSEFAPTYPPQVADLTYGRVFAPALTNHLSFFRLTTPGAPNTWPIALPFDVTHSPARPSDGDDITVTARVAVPGHLALSSLTVHFRTDYGTESSTTMRDDGQGSDAAAGDGVFTAVIPQSLSGPGQMVRWRTEARALGSLFTGKAPAFLRPTDSAEYFGTMVADPSFSTPLPTLFWFVQSPSAADQPTGTRCSVFYDGGFYDNVLVRPRGQTSGSWPKKNYKFDFNSESHFTYDRGSAPVEEINVNSTWSDKTFLRQILVWNWYEHVEVPGSRCFPLRLQQNRSFFSMALFVEEPEERMLERVGLDPRGALYKMFNPLDSGIGGYRKKTRQNEGTQDLQALVAGLALTGQARERFLFDHVDVPAVVNYLAVTICGFSEDHIDKNYYLYRDTEGDGEWRFVPWDRDLTLSRNTTSAGVLNDFVWADQDPICHPLFGDHRRPKQGNANAWNRLVDAIHETPRARAMYLRRLRSVMDTYLQPSATPLGRRYFEGRIDHWRALVQADVTLDQARWGVPNYGDPTLTFARAVTQLRDVFLPRRRRHLYETHGPSGSGIVPPAQDPRPAVTFGDLEPTAATNPNEAYVELRNCSAVAIDMSWWRVVRGVDFTLPPGTVIAPNDSMYIAADVTAFRARTSDPRGGQGRLLVGPFRGTLDPGEPLALLDDAGLVVDRIDAAHYSLTSSGVGDLTIELRDVAPGAEVYLPFSAQTTWPLGCGPFLGLGFDVAPIFGLPAGSAPFHVFADQSGRYTFSLPSGLPSGLVLDSRPLWYDPNDAAWKVGPIRRVRF